ncbi:MAG: hypothetical protein WAX69_24365 [Victivallales bacterium]
MKSFNLPIMAAVFFLFVMGIQLPGQDAENKEVTGVGTAEGNPDAASEQALAQALRDAVRKGAGVDVMGETKVENFQTEYDRVLTSSFGYVEKYEITEQKYDNKAKTYTVKIKAVVKKGTPGMDNVMALRLIVKRVESPRVLVACDEKIIGLDNKSTLANDTLTEMAQKSGFQVIDKEAVDIRSEKEARRDELLGDDKSAKVKRSGIANQYDIIITGTVTGEIGAIEEPFPDMKTRDISLGFNLKALWADSGETIAVAKLPAATYQAKGLDPVTLPNQLARKYLAKVLEGQDVELKDENAYKLFRKIISKWITELDLGAKIRVELKQIDKKSLDDLIASLQGTSSISYVWLREFDSRLFSVVEVETRLASPKLADEILKKLGTRYVLDQSTKRNLRFMPK